MRSKKRTSKAPRTGHTAEPAILSSQKDKFKKKEDLRRYQGNYGDVTVQGRTKRGWHKMASDSNGWHARGFKAKLFLTMNGVMVGLPF